jgi:hypothetical protein
MRKTKLTKQDLGFRVHAKNNELLKETESGFQNLPMLGLGLRACPTQRTIAFSLTVKSGGLIVHLPLLQTPPIVGVHTDHLASSLKRPIHLAHQLGVLAQKSFTQFCMSAFILACARSIHSLVASLSQTSRLGIFSRTTCGFRAVT